MSLPRSREQVPLPDQLGDDDLRRAAGGRKAGKEQQEFLTFSMKEALIGSFSSGS